MSNRSVRPARSLAVCFALVAPLVASCAHDDDAPAAPAAELLAPPPSGQGFQLGTPTFAVAPGSEVQNCYFFEVPSDGELFVDRVTLAQEPGSHHFNVFRVNTVKNLGVGAKDGTIVEGGECWKSGNWSDWALVINSQQSEAGNNVIDWKLPEGVAHKFKAHELLMLQSHYVNATTQTTPGAGRALVNFWKADPAKVTAELGTVFTTNQNIKICPGDVDKTFTATCKFARSDLTIVGANGHFHSRGTKFTISTWDAVSGAASEPFYTSTQWDDPPFVRDAHIALGPNGGVSYSCAFTAPPTACANPDGGVPDGGKPGDECCYTFGPHVDQNEHCNAFIYYYPKQADINCF